MSQNGKKGKSPSVSKLLAGEVSFMNANAAFREWAEETERLRLSKYAMLSRETKGRAYPMEPCPMRTEFVRDRDRIIHCKSFRRLKHKTQVFLAPSGDHYRTRLTHTLEVNQIARSIARALRLNEDLTEAVALGHDLGHTPFGHAGETVLNSLVPSGFEHNEQSLRIVEKLENGVGLNLTYEVRNGILNHKLGAVPCTLEGTVVNISDRIAYINHDIDDAIRAGVLDPSELPRDCVEGLGAYNGQRIDTLIRDVVMTSFDKPFVAMSAPISALVDELRAFMFKSVYTNPKAKGEESKAKALLASLFEYYMKRPELLPAEFYANIDTDGAERVVADHLACMTDGYAINLYSEFFVPKGWA